MALLWVDGFEGYRTTCTWGQLSTALLLRRYSSVGAVNRHLITDGRFSTYALKIHEDATGWLNTPNLTTNNTLIIGVAITSSSPSTGRILSLYDGATQGINLRRSYSELALYRGSTLLATTSGLNFPPNQWRYIELKVVCHDTTGSYELRVGENIELSASSVDTKEGSNNYHNNIRLWGEGGQHTLDDFYICDGSGSDNNTFLGNVRIDDIYPNGDDSIQWTRSGGSTNYENVDENPLADDDTSYVEDSTTNNTDLYDYESVSGIGLIKGIQINTICKETDANSFSLITPVDLAGNQSDDSAQTISSSTYRTLMRVVERDPDGNLWTINNVNAAKFGVKVG